MDENSPKNAGYHRRILTQPNFSTGPSYNNFFTPREFVPPHLDVSRQASGYEMNRSLKNSMKNKPRKIGSPDLPLEKFESPEPCKRSPNQLQVAPSTPKSKTRRIRSPVSPMLPPSASKPRQPGPTIQQQPPQPEKHFEALTPIKRESASFIKNTFASPNVVPCRSSTLLKNELKN